MNIWHIAIVAAAVYLFTKQKPAPELPKDPDPSDPQDIEYEEVQQTSVYAEFEDTKLGIIPGCQVECDATFNGEAGKEISLLSMMLEVEPGKSSHNPGITTPPHKKEIARQTFDNQKLSDDGTATVKATFRFNPQSYGLSEWRGNLYTLSLTYNYKGETFTDEFEFDQR